MPDEEMYINIAKLEKGSTARNSKTNLEEKFNPRETCGLVGAIVGRCLTPTLSIGEMK